jgi:hypothetical protein
MTHIQNTTAAAANQPTEMTMSDPIQAAGAAQDLERRGICSRIRIRASLLVNQNH